MVIVGGVIEYNPEDRDKLFPHLRTMIAASNAEEGCLAYEFSPDISKENILHLYEVWVSDEALQQHSDSAHMAAFNENARPCMGSRDIKRYNAELVS